MKVLIPMAGAGKRFSESGYKVHKPVIMTIDRKTGNEYPMVVCATKDLPEVEADGKNIIYVDRDFHKADGVEEIIKEHYPRAMFITIDYLTEGQASTCLLAKEYIDNEEELLIAGCDNGMVYNQERFGQLKKECDAIIFTYRNNPAVLNNPDAYGWMKINEENKVIGTSVKRKISDNPMQDHAVVATFWFKRGSDFVKAAEKMIAEKDRVNGEFYVDKVVDHMLDLGIDVRVFEIERYIGWGTPVDYENYMNTYEYWRKFVEGEYFLPERM